MDVVLNLLFTNPIGVLSLFTIVFIIGMAIYMMQRRVPAPSPSFLAAGTADPSFPPPPSTRRHGWTAAHR